jgi:hypothetical protein
VVRATEFGDVTVGGHVVGVLRATTGDIAEVVVTGNVSGTIESQAGSLGTAGIGGQRLGLDIVGRNITLLDIDGDLSGSVASGGNVMC